MMNPALFGAVSIVSLTMLEVSEAVASSSASVTSATAYVEFRATYRVTEEEDSVDFITRLQMFEARVREIEDHNARGDSSWVAGLNKFADYTDEEFGMMLGYRRTSPRNSGPSSFLELHAGPSDHGLKVKRSVAKSKDWRQQLNAAGFIRDQGRCGSCWAVAAVGALEMHAEIAGSHAEPLSFAQLVNCVENKHHCGGEGGCRGATAELAFGHVKDHGIAAEVEYHKAQTNKVCDRDQPPTTFSSGFVQLAVNKYEPLLDAVANRGPTVVSVDGSKWSLYQQGVFDSCARDTVVNHAVLAVGYGHDSKYDKNYWLIRNSWGPSYGEAGHIRVLRHEADDADWDAGYCGTDNKPEDGVFCDDHPKTVPVCGMCGILSDSAYPTGVRTTYKSAL